MYLVHRIIFLVQFILSIENTELCKIHYAFLEVVLKLCQYITKENYPLITLTLQLWFDSQENAGCICDPPCMSLIASRYCHAEEPILSRYNGLFEVCSDVLLTPYNKGFLDLQLKFVSQVNNGKPNCGMYELLITTISRHWFSLISLC